MDRPSTYNILIIDDDPVDRRTILRELTKANVLNPVYEAADGLDALRTLQDLTGSVLILLDINMSPMDGFEFLNALKKLDLPLKITTLILTTSNNDQDRLRAKQFDVSGYLTKNNFRHVLFSKIDSINSEIFTFEIKGSKSGS